MTCALRLLAWLARLPWLRWLSEPPRWEPRLRDDAAPALCDAVTKSCSVVAAAGRAYGAADTAAAVAKADAFDAAFRAPPPPPPVDPATDSGPYSDVIARRGTWSGDRDGGVSARVGGVASRRARVPPREKLPTSMEPNSSHPTRNNYFPKL